MVMDAAVKQDQGRDVRMEASMIKVFATEMATEVIDHAPPSRHSRPWASRLNCRSR